VKIVIEKRYLPLTASLVKYQQVHARFDARKASWWQLVNKSNCSLRKKLVPKPLQTLRHNDRAWQDGEQPTTVLKQINRPTDERGFQRHISNGRPGTTIIARSFKAAQFPFCRSERRVHHDAVEFWTGTASRPGKEIRVYELGARRQRTAVAPGKTGNRPNI
jgi:hypothetical protein